MLLSNVYINYAYSLFSGLMCGNANIVRVPSKEFPQVSIINAAIEKALEDHPEMRPYISFVRHDGDKEINDYLSSLCDVRVIWGDDATIEEIRKSPLKPRATEVTFVDRYSLAVADADECDDVKHHTMDFNLKWDGYDLAERFTRNVAF